MWSSSAHVDNFQELFSSQLLVALLTYRLFFLNFWSQIYDAWCVQKSIVHYIFWTTLNEPVLTLSQTREPWSDAMCSEWNKSRGHGSYGHNLILFEYIKLLFNILVFCSNWSLLDSFVLFFLFFLLYIVSLVNLSKSTVSYFLEIKLYNCYLFSLITQMFFIF